jgi:hypothetical protein
MPMSDANPPLSSDNVSNFVHRPYLLPESYRANRDGIGVLFWNFASTMARVSVSEFTSTISREMTGLRFSTTSAH